MFENKYVTHASIDRSAVNRELGFLQKIPDDFKWPIIVADNR